MTIPSSQPVVLCTDTDRRAADIRAAILRQAGFKVFPAYGAESALDILASVAADAVLLRYEMAPRNGLELAREIKRRHPRLPLLMLGARLAPPPGAKDVIDAFVHNIEAPQRWLQRLAGLIARRGITVLNVDDNCAQRYAVTRMLQTSGFKVEEAASGEETLRAVAHHPDLVLLDVNLPDISGFEVCRAIKRDPETAAIPVLHLSATYATSPFHDEGLRAGAVAYLTHPIDREQLTAAVQAAIESQGSHLDPGLPPSS